MGTVFEIVIYDDDLVEAAAAARAALDEVVRLDGVMSNYKPESELSRMNRTAHFAPVRISPELYEVIDESLYYSRISGGQFDISVGPVVDLWKAALAGGPLPTSAEQSAALRCVGYQKIELLPPVRIQFHSDCMRLDLGAIGKGYAIDRVVELLKARGIRRAYIDAGGSTIYALGAPPGRMHGTSACATLPANWSRKQRYRITASRLLSRARRACCKKPRRGTSFFPAQESPCKHSTQSASQRHPLPPPMRSQLLYSCSGLRKGRRWRRRCMMCRLFGSILTASGNLPATAQVSG
jgi:hypothetical protein